MKVTRHARRPRRPWTRGMPAIRLRHRPTDPAKALGVIDDAIPIRGIRGNLIAATDGVWAAYRLTEAPYDLTSPQDQLSLVRAQQLRWSELAGHRVQIRSTQHAFPHAAWAAAFDEASPRKVADVDGSETWADYLAASQRLAIHAALEVPTVFLLVRISTRRPDLDDLDRHARAALARVTASVQRDGFGAVPATARAIAWLTHTSIAIGVPAPDVHVGDGAMTTRDMGIFVTPVAHISTPYSPTVEVMALRNGHAIQRHATVLSMGRVEDRPQIGRTPWMAWARNLPYPVEWVATLDVVDGHDLADAAEDRRRLLVDQERHYTEHGEECPSEVTRALQTARRAEDETSSAPRETAVRLVGTVRVAISGTSPVEVQARVEDFTSMSARAQKIEWVQTHGQVALIGEFVPTAPAALPGMVRWIPAAFMGCAVPNLAVTAGTPAGPLLGSTISAGRTAVLFDPTYGPRRNGSGLIMLCGGLGSGKSTLEGLLIEQTARRGLQAVALDPSGPLTRIAYLPYLRRHSRVIDLSKARPGTLNPYTLIPDPHQGDYPDTPDGAQEYRVAVASAQAERRELMMDAVAMLMPGSMMSGPTGGATVAAIRAAVADSPAGFGADPWRVVTNLDQAGDTGKAVAAILRDASKQLGACLLFPAADQDWSAPPSDALLTIITTPGVTPPSAGSRREHWTSGEQAAATVLHLAGRYTARAMYSSKEPKLIAVDELGLTGRGESALAGFLERGSRDSRKWHTAVVLGSQNPTDFAGISSEIRNLVGAVFAGRMQDTDAASTALTLAGVPVGIGYEQALMRLDPGQFLLRSWGRCPQLVQVAIGHRPAVADVLDTTPVAEGRDVFAADDVFA